MTVAPIARVALAYGSGVAAGLLSVPIQVTLLVLIGAAGWPIRSSRRPLTFRAGLVMTAAAGALAGYGTGRNGNDERNMNHMSPYPPWDARCISGMRKTKGVDALIFSHL